MLVLSRQKNEAIMIGDDVEITIVDIKGDKVRLGIKAPLSVPVHRREVYIEIKQANVEAAKVGTEALDGMGQFAAMLGKPADAKGVFPAAQPDPNSARPGGSTGKPK
jgi:carbon storage regulator